jgi:methyl-accepting chemotaxis protein
MSSAESSQSTGHKISIEAAQLALLEGQIAAINRSQAVIQFELDGRIISANENFLATLGYSLDEVRGKHHSMFVDPAYRASEEYRRFWEKLGRGEYDAAQYKRIGKGGREVWIQATYNPILDGNGKPVRVVKFATDITASVRDAQANSRIRTALDKASASVMLADEGLNIIYVNDAGEKLFRENQDSFRQDLPGFDATRIVGSSMDMFHRNPAHQRQLLSSLRSPHVSDVRIGGRAMRIAATPVIDSAGVRLGTVVEWADRTQEVMSEEQVTDIVKKALSGDLSGRVSTEDKAGFYKMLAQGLNELLDNTAGIVRQVQLAAAEVHRGAEEISQGNVNLSQRTEEQSSSLEETASSMEEMTSTVKQNADNAAQASQLAMAAREQAEKGGAVVGQAVRAMGSINEASKKIADIIGVIDEIAFQTNLLALNAAVEAARAGEQGRGFAVVATEVRSLAGRSATAAKEIKDLIQDSVRKVEDGSTLVTQSGQTLDQIVASVKKVSDIVSEIADASREQSSGIEQVNKAVMQMDEMTQQNAALVEEAAATSQSMAEQARELNESMERYRLEEGSAPAPRRAEIAPPAARATERRGANRPWTPAPAQSRRQPARAPVRKAPARSVAPTGTDDAADWHEF